MELNLRDVLKYDFDKDFFIVVVIRFLYIDMWGCDRFINVWCYGKCVKIFEIIYRMGYKLKRKILLKINKKDVDGGVYVDIVFFIEYINSEVF